MSGEPWYSDHEMSLLLGTAEEVLASSVDDGVADCIVTSPPYFGLRDYGVPGQIGLEDSPEAYVEALRRVFAQAARVLRPSGTLWLNLGDSYASGVGLKRGPGSALQGRGVAAAQTAVGANRWRKPGVRLPRKSLLGMPWRVAFALQEDGWILRNAIVWAKPNGMPESVRDRFTVRHEHVFLFSRAADYYFNLEPLREPGSGRNPGDVWVLPTQHYSGAHLAVMPEALAERCVLAGSRPRGVVLDPFMGSGTTGLAALRHGRRFVGVDVVEEYLSLALRTRLREASLDLWGEQ